MNHGQILQEDAYFSQALTLTEGRKDKLQGTWITKGRMEVLVGKEETATVLEEEWYLTKTGTKGQLLIFYTEESIEQVREKTIKKEIKGGCHVEVEQGRNMLADAAISSFGAAMLGDEEPSEEECKAEQPTGMGGGMIKKPAVAEPPAPQSPLKSAAEKRAATIAANKKNQEEKVLAAEKKAKDFEDSPADPLHNVSGSGLLQALPLQAMRLGMHGCLTDR